VKETGSRTGVYLCTCNGTLEKALDFEVLADYLRPYVGEVKVVDSLCTIPGQEFLRNEANREDIERILTAGCSPKSHRPIIERAIHESKLNPYLHEHLNIREQCAWVHRDREKGTEKAKFLLSGALARLENLQPLEDIEVDILPSALIIGGGVAGMQCALDIAEKGFEAYLIERTGKLGGRTYELNMTFPTHNCGICCVQSCKMCALTPKIEDVFSHENIHVFLNTEVKEISGVLGNRTVKLKGPEGEKEINAGVLIIATGSQVFDADRIPEYHHEHPDVVTTLELEHLLMESREGGELGRPSDGKVPGTVNFIQCVGSRDRNKGNLHCSLVCCTYSIGQAMELKSRYPDMNVFIHYIDLRGPYRGFEEFYFQAKEMGINFMRGRVGEVFIEDGHPVIRTIDEDLGGPVEIQSDLVVLTVGQEVRPDTAELAESLHLPRDEDGFLKYLNPMLSAEMRKGIFVAGCAQGPKGIRYSIEDSRLSAAWAIELMERGKAHLSGAKAVVNEEKCRGCGACVEICEFDAPKLEWRENRRVSVIDPVICEGCGMCVAECCNGALSIRHFRREEILPMISAELGASLRDAGGEEVA